MSVKEKFKLGRYNVGIIRQDISSLLTGEEYDIIWLKHDYKDRFFADPFLLREDSEIYYILAEEFCFFENVGKISLLYVRKKDFSLLKKEILIQESYHMSFPYSDGNWIYPEAYRSGAYYRYEIADIKNKEKISRNALIDSIPVTIDGQEWLLSMTADKPLENLYLLKKNLNGMYEMCSDRPIKKDIKYSRPAGKTFERNGFLYRPVQDSEEMYGKQTHIMQICEIDDYQICEEPVITIDSNRFAPYNQGLHTFNVYNGFIIVDGYYETYSYIRKSIWVKFPELVKKYKKFTGKY